MKRKQDPHGLTVIISLDLYFLKGLNRFKRKIRDHKFMQQIKAKSYYLKPSITKRKKASKLKHKYKMILLLKKANKL